MSTVATHERQALHQRVAEQGTHLIDAVTVVHGARRLVAEFFLLANALLHDRGCYARVHSDMRGLQEINETEQSSWGPLGPMFDYRASDLSADTCFWVSVHAADHELIATCAARLFEPGPGGMLDEFESLRIYYRDPERHLRNGFRLKAIAPADEKLAAMHGRVSYLGASWTHPDSRGAGIIYIISRIVRALSLTRWEINHLISMVRADPTQDNLYGRYGYTGACAGLRLEGSYRGDMDLHLVWTDRPGIEADTAAYMERNPRQAMD